MAIPKPQTRKSTTLSTMAYVLLVISIFIPHVSEAHIVSYSTIKDYGAGVSFSPFEPPQVGVESRVFIFLFNATTGGPFTKLDVAHERLLHVFIVSEDLREFAHIHPEDFQGLAAKDYGYYSVNYTFNKTGRYAIAADYSINGQNVLNLMYVSPAGVTPMESHDNYLGRVREFQGYTITLEAPETIETGKETDLDFRIEKDGKPVRGIEMLLGSEVHVLIMKSDLENAGHTHAYRPGHYTHAGSMPQAYFGPVVPVRYVFEQPGTYAVFGQFKHNNTIVTTRFIVEVAQGIQSAEVLEKYNLLGLAIIAIQIVGIVVVVLFLTYRARKSKKQSKRFRYVYKP